MSSWSSINLPNIFPTIFPTIIPRYSKDIPMNHQFLTMSHMHPSIQFHVIMWFPMISFVSSRLFHCHPTSACPVSYTHISIYTCIHIYICIYICIYIYVYPAIPSHFAGQVMHQRGTWEPMVIDLRLGFVRWFQQDRWDSSEVNRHDLYLTMKNGDLLGCIGIYPLVMSK